MAGREWMITKVAITLLAILTIVSISVGASLVVGNMKKDITLNASDIKDESLGQKEKWVKNSADHRDMREVVDGVKTIQTEIRISQSKTTADYSHILREIEKLNIKFDNFEVTL